MTGGTSKTAPPEDTASAPVVDDLARWLLRFASLLRRTPFGVLHFFSKIEKLVIKRLK
jgi:hypothetical protein